MTFTIWKSHSGLLRIERSRAIPAKGTNWTLLDEAALAITFSILAQRRSRLCCAFLNPRRHLQIPPEFRQVVAKLYQRSGRVLW